MYLISIVLKRSPRLLFPNYSSPILDMNDRDKGEGEEWEEGEEKEEDEVHE
jgi:hypothetical protein